MTAAVRDLLHSFAALSAPEQHEALVAILQQQPEGDVPEAALLELADERFVEMDRAESSHG
jgi:hypothetical protein